MGVLKNPRHERFAQNVASGNMLQRNAYIDAYPNAAKWSDSAQDANASRLANDQDVKARIAELQQAAASDTIVTITGRKERLSGIIMGDTSPLKYVISAIDLLNKMDGIYVQKVDANVSAPSISETAKRVTAIMEEQDE